MAGARDEHELRCRRAGHLLLVGAAVRGGDRVRAPGAGTSVRVRRQRRGERGCRGLLPLLLGGDALHALRELGRHLHRRPRLGLVPRRPRLQLGPRRGGALRAVLAVGRPGSRRAGQRGPGHSRHELRVALRRRRRRPRLGRRALARRRTGHGHPRPHGAHARRRQGRSVDRRSRRRGRGLGDAPPFVRIICRPTAPRSHAGRRRSSSCRRRGPEDGATVSWRSDRDGPWAAASRSAGRICRSARTA